MLFVDLNECTMNTHNCNANNNNYIRYVILSDAFNKDVITVIIPLDLSRAPAN